MIRILLVEDDDGLREVISDFLNQKDYYVVAVSNGKKAREIFSSGDFNLIISDVQMPFLNGVELLQWIRERSKIPFILITGFTNLLETKNAFDYGANGFLTKPFKSDELFRILSEVLKPAEEIKSDTITDNLDSQFCKVPIDEFVARPLIDFDIFVLLKAEKYIKIARTGEILDKERLKTYKDKGVDSLHIKKEDFSKIIQFNLKVSKALQSSLKITKEKKINFIKYSAQVILEKCFVDNIDRQVFLDAKDFMTCSMEVLSQDDELFYLMDVLNYHSDQLYAHSLGVAIYSIMIAKKMQFESTQVYFKLSMAGLFHDIGKKEIDKEIIDKPRKLMNADERKIFETHALRSREVLETISGIPQDVVQIVYEHHEDGIGNGYPRAISKLIQHPLSCIVYLADLFVTKALKNSVNPESDANSALNHIIRYDLDRVDTKALSALRSIYLDHQTTDLESN
jgi:putative nucleotidyltransferase with HDIG domain